MSVIQISLLCICCVLLLLALKQYDLSYSVMAAVLMSLFILSHTCSYLTEIINRLSEYRDKMGETYFYIQILLKAVGTAFISSFAANVCKDAGFAGLGKQMEVLGKAYILLLGVPIVFSLVELIEHLC